MVIKTAGVGRRVFVYDEPTGVEYFCTDSMVAYDHAVSTRQRASAGALPLLHVSSLSFHHEDKYKHLLAILSTPLASVPLIKKQLLRL